MGVQNASWRPYTCRPRAIALPAVTANADSRKALACQLAQALSILGQVNASATRSDLPETAEDELFRAIAAITRAIDILDIPSAPE